MKESNILVINVNFKQKENLTYRDIKDLNMKNKMMDILSANLFGWHASKSNLSLTHAVSLETSLIEGAALVAGAGGHTDAVTALQVLRAVGGGEAGARDPDALHLGVPGEVLGADALLPVPVHAALGVEAAAALDGAGVLTPSRVTNLIGGAVSVRGTRF